jgi:cyclic pyranopterin phosphate synthase
MAELIDACGRRIDYLRLSVTDRCDLRCTYCMPPEFDDYEPPAQWLTFDELERVACIFVTLGVSRIRLTGGEPLLRARISELARRLKGNAGLRDLSLSTNGTQLARHAARLRAAGVDRLNVSLDTLSRERFVQITRRDALGDIAGLLHGMPLPPEGIVVVILLGAFLAGFFLDWLEISLIFLPLFGPVVGRSAST